MAASPSPASEHTALDDERRQSNGAAGPSAGPPPADAGSPRPGSMEKIVRGRVMGECWIWDAANPPRLSPLRV